VVVVDGESTDGSRQQLTELAGGAFRVITSPRGRARQMNAGARATTAPVLLFLHADTRLPDPPAVIAAAAGAARRGALGGCFRLRIASRDPRLRLAAHLINLRSRVLPSATGDQAIFVTRRAYEQLGGFRELQLCEDLDLVSRLSSLGRFELQSALVETSARRWRECGIGRTIALMWALRIGYHLGVSPSMLGRLYGADVR
jgi:rSAM/selenodomain-associated transferase 2